MLTAALQLSEASAEPQNRSSGDGDVRSNKQGALSD